MGSMREHYDLQELSRVMEGASLSLLNAVRYIYAVAADGFYNINIKDLFKVALSDITDPDVLSSLGIPVNSVKFAEFKTEEFRNLSKLILYAFAVRLPFLRRVENSALKDSALYALYEACVEKGARNIDDIVYGDFKSMMKTAKTRESEPGFNGEWFRRWVYTRGGELAAITNENMFLLGCMDALLPLFYSKLTDELIEMCKV